MAPKTSQKQQYKFYSNFTLKFYSKETIIIIFMLIVMQPMLLHKQHYFVILTYLFVSSFYDVDCDVVKWIKSMVDFSILSSAWIEIC